MDKNATEVSTSSKDKLRLKVAVYCRVATADQAILFRKEVNPDDQSSD